MTKPAPVNYDAVADSYNQRMPKMHLAGIAAAAPQNLARQVNARRVLDLGCGTGLVDRMCYGFKR